jgi:hypothetical protein
MKKMILSLFVVFIALFTFNIKVNAEDLSGENIEEVNLEEELIGQETNVVISKVDKNDVPVIGSKLQILDLEGNILYEWTTDGTDFEVMLPAGKYILHEVEAPEGYEISADQEFEIEVIIEDEIIGDADMNEYPCDHGEDNASPMYYVTIKGVSYETYCINQGLATPNGNDYNGQIITPDELREFTKQETNIDTEGYTINKYIYVNTETVPDYDVSDQTMSNRELYDKVLDIIYHRHLAVKDPRFINLSVGEIRFVTEIALKNYLNARITTYETDRVLNGTKIAHVAYNANGELWKTGDGTKYYKIYNKFYNREYLYDESSPTGYIICSGQGDAMGNFAKHWYHGHGSTKVPKIYVDLFYFLINDESKHPESMQLFMYSPTSNADDIYQNLLGITGYIEDAMVKSQAVKMSSNYSNETRDIKVNKVWIDEPFGKSKRPEEISIELYADGELFKQITLSKENNWSYTFEGLQMYKDGKKIEYTILELEVPEYETSIKGDMENGFVIINTLNEKLVPSEGIDEIQNPKTFDNIIYKFLLMIISLIGITSILLQKKRYN